MGGGKNTSRILWIDLLKGLTIIGVIFIHASGSPDWWKPSHVNAPFFFMAGMFFKAKPFGEFIQKNSYSLLIPFLLFFILSYPFRIIVELWDYRSFDAVKWSMIFDLFKVEARTDYLYSNVPLWFLLCLFWVQFFYWFISHFPLWAKVLILSGLWIFSDVIYSIPTPFMINNALYWTVFFGLGNLLGKFIIEIAENKFTTISIVIVGGFILLGIDYLIEKSSITETLFYALWCIIILFAGALLNRKKGILLDWLGFFGTNTLAILGFHIWVETPIARIFLKFFVNPTPAIAVAITILTTLISIPLILFFNKRFPLLIGKGLSKR